MICMIASIVAFSCAVVPEARAGAEMRLRLEEQGFILENASDLSTVILSAQAPIFDFGEFQVGGSAAGPGTWRKIHAGSGRGWRGVWRTDGDPPAEILAELRLDRGRRLLRKIAEIRLLEGPCGLLQSVVVDEVDAKGGALSHRPDWQSRPVFGESFFFGIEFPVATTAVVEGRARLSHAPGRKVAHGQTFRSFAAVYGASLPGRAREAFEDTIASIRPAGRSVHFNYNSWWTSPVPYAESDILNILSQFRENLFVPYGAAPDSFCIDMGWSNSKSVWTVDASLFPEGFKGIQQAAEAMGSGLGLWISPSAVYDQALDLAWAKDHGFEADRKACLAGPNYQQAFKQSLSDLVGTHDMRHVKLDGYVPSCEETGHGHEPGPLSIEPMARGIIDVMQGAREASPRVWLEPTCFGFDPSPWWLQWADSVIGTYGDDAPAGRVPCPIYRESYTTARDFYNLKGAFHMALPIAAQEVLGIVHQAPEPLQNDAILCVLRGHQFISLYVNPRFMDDRRWEFLAALMKWARHNQGILSTTRPVLPGTWRLSQQVPGVWQEGPALREPYGYAHGEPGRGLLCLRNPWIAETEVELRCREDLGWDVSTDSIQFASIYPDKDGIFEPDSQGILRIPMRPYETVVFASQPAKRQNEAQSKPGQDRPETKIDVHAVRFGCVDSGARLGPNFTRSLEGGDHLKISIEGDVLSPNLQGCACELWILVEDDKPLVAPIGEIRVRGEIVPPQTYPSETGWRATGASPPEHWVWLVAPLPAGRSHLQGEWILAGPSGKASCWIVQRETIPWEQQANLDGRHLPRPEERFLCSVPLFQSMTLSEGLPAETGKGPETRIQGVYLDSLSPTLSEQGWGTLQINQSVWSKPLTIGGRRFVRGLGAHAPSRIAFDLQGRYRRFKASAGADQATGPTITLEVRVDGETRWQSGLLTRNSPVQPVDVDVTGAKTLELVVGDGGNGLSADHADWADAQILE